MKQRSRQALTNEQLSANYALRLLHRAGVDDEFKILVRDIILATLSRQLANTNDETFVSDVDWSVLGLPWEEYAAYVAKVRREFTIYSDKEFLVGRTGWILNNMRDRHFVHDVFNERFNAQTQANLAHELEAYRDFDYPKLWQLP